MANAAPFGVRWNQDRSALEPFNIDISQSAQILHSHNVRPFIFTVQANDINISDRPGFKILESAMTGLSGGPMIDAADGTAAGICFMGEPPDAFRKDWVGALDIRRFPFAN